jgi:regulator of sigma E protease
VGARQGRALLMEILRGTIAILFTFSFAIFVHEMGHFMFAKWFGVFVETFSIGFGRKILKRKWGETEYAIGMVPFGGYVKLRGMHSKELEQLLKDEDAPEHGKDDAARPKETMSESVVEEMAALRNKAYWQKVLLFSAGCINNFLTAVTVYFLMAWVGFHEAEPPKPVIDRLEHVTSEQVALRPGDRVVKVGMQQIETFEDLLDEFEKYARINHARLVPLDVERGGNVEKISVPVWPDPSFPPEGEKIVQVEGKPVKSVKEAAEIAAKQIDRKNEIEVITERGGRQTKHSVSPIAAVGWYWPQVAILPYEIPFVAMPLPNLPAEKAGFRSGDIVVSVNGQQVSSRAKATELIRARLGSETPVEVRRGDKVLGLTVQVRPDPERPSRGQIGIYWGAPPTKLHKLAFIPAWEEAFSRAFRLIFAYGRQLKELLSSSFQTIRENVGGPIAIGTLTYKAAQQGALWFFELFAMLNILLAVTNLLPLPVFDGGHILFATIEAIIRRPLPARALVRIYNVFIVLIIGLAVIISFNDVIMNAWRLPF